MTNLKRPGYQFLWAVLTLTLATSVAKAQTYTDLHDFNETEGCCTAAPSLLAQGEDGDIYGATTSGGVTRVGSLTSWSAGFAAASRPRSFSNRQLANCVFAGRAGFDAGCALGGPGLRAPKALD